MLKYIDKLILYFDIKIKSIWSKYDYRGLAISLFIHILILLTIIILNTSKPIVRKIKIVQLDSRNFIEQNYLPKNLQEKLEGLFSPKPITPEKVKEDTSKQFSYELEPAPFDSLSITSEYSENDINVSIFFPKDWYFLENKDKQMLDAIIFIPKDSSKYNKSISVSLQADHVGTLFNKAYYDSSYVLNNMEYFIATPENTFGQITQQVYVKPNFVEEKFLIRLIAPSEEEYQKFKMIFDAMIKSFRVGK